MLADAFTGSFLGLCVVASTFLGALHFIFDLLGISFDTNCFLENTLLLEESSSLLFDTLLGSRDCLTGDSSSLELSLEEFELLSLLELLDEPLEESLESFEESLAELSSSSEELSSFA